jgi:hypothetical protein
MEFQSLRKAGIARTPRRASGAGAAGVGRLAGMTSVYRQALMGFGRAKKDLLLG